MGQPNLPSPQEPQPAPSLAAVPFLERKLDELFEALKDARYSKSLLEAKACLRARDYSKALQLIEATRQLCTPAVANNGRKPAATPRGARPARASSVQVLSGLDTVLRLLKPLGDWHERQPKPAEIGSSPPVASALASKPLTEQSSQEQSIEEPVDSRRQYSTLVLERGVFSQLLTAAQQCGLVPNADVIIAVRDREVPAERYQKAFEMIEGLYNQFSAQASRRIAELRQEEMRYKAGTLKMSMKEWLIRQRRVIEQNQKIERARRHFTRVLDALRVIRTSDPD